MTIAYFTVRRLTPFRIISWLSLHFINKTIFQLVLQLTEFTCRQQTEFETAEGFRALTLYTAKTDQHEDYHHFLQLHYDRGLSNIKIHVNI